MSGVGSLYSMARPLPEYQGKESFFGGTPPLDEWIGYLIVLGFGAIFSVITTGIIFLQRKFGKQGKMTSEHFNTAGRMIKTGLTSSVIISQWTWAATLLQSSNVAWQYGVSGPFWYASGATIQILLFGVLAISLKTVAPRAHTFLEIVYARWGTKAHLTFMFFGFCASIIVTSMLLLGGAATVEALTGMDYRLASFLIPWGVILYTSAGGLQATFLASYIHTAIIFAVLMIMITIVYIKIYSSDLIYDFLDQTSTFTEEECQKVYSTDGTVETTFYDADTYACGPIDGNYDGSYLTMISSGGLMFGIINIVGNFGTVFVDQSYWQSAIAANPVGAAKGYLLGGICWFAIPFSLATSLGLSSTALMLPLTADEAGSGLVPPASATHLLGTTGSVLMAIMLFMAIVSTGSAESIAISSLVSYDIYRHYFKPDATGDDILKCSRIVIVIFGLFMGAFAIALSEMGLNLGWVYLFMGIVIGSAVMPLWFMMTWSKASGTGAVVAAWTGFICAVSAWLITCSVRMGDITVDNLGNNVVMLTGNLVAILGSGTIHILWSLFIDPTDYDFSEMNTKIRLVEEDMRGLGEEVLDAKVLKDAYIWITRRGYLMTFIFAIAWPLLSVPAGKFTVEYFSFWVLVAIAYGFGAALVEIFLPLYESSDDIFYIIESMKLSIQGKTRGVEKELEDEVEEPSKEIEAA